MHVFAIGQRGECSPASFRNLCLIPHLESRDESRTVMPWWAGITIDDPVRATVMVSKVPMTKTRSYSIIGDVQAQ